MTTPDFNLPRAGLGLVERYIGWGDPDKPVDLSVPLGLVMDPRAAAPTPTLVLFALVCAAVAALLVAAVWADRREQENRETRLLVRGPQGAFA